MDTSNGFKWRKSIVLFALVAVIAALGCYAGLKTLDRYDTVVRAVLGLTVLYSFFRYYVPQKRTISTSDEDYIPPSKYHRFLAMVFYTSLVCFWAGMQVIRFVQDLIRLAGAK